MLYTFFFGYHDPDDWRLFQEYPDFDCESTGILVIEAPTEEAAYTWGLTVATWYAGRLHGQGTTYSWSENDYAAWAVEGEDEAPQDTTRVKHGVLPDFGTLRRSLND